MTEVEKIIEGIILEHGRAPYDPVKAREYYLRTRELKGRRPGSSQPAKPAPKRILYEDEVPEKSRSGARLLTFDSRNGAIYADGSVYNLDGWSKTDPATLKRMQKIADLYDQMGPISRQISDLKDPVKKRRLQTQLDTLRIKVEALQKPGNRNDGTSRGQRI